MITALREAGVNPAAFLAGRDVDIETIEGGDKRLSVDRLPHLWDDAAVAAGDRLFGLHAGAGIEEHTFGVFSFLAATSETWGEGLERVCRYFRMVTDFGRYELAVDGATASLLFVLDPRVRGVSPHLCDFVVAVAFTYGRRFADGFQVREVLLPYPAPPDTADHERFFSAPVRFGKALGFVFPAALLGARMRTAAPRLAALLERIAEEKIAGLPAADPLTEVRLAIRAGAHAGNVSLGAIARRLHVSPRTLQRQLALADTRFAAELDRVRHEMAIALLGQPELRLQEIGFLLGFSEPATFYRAFRRWTGVSPGRYRQSAVESDEGSEP
ncbi:MAG: AraC family transcriptional regulator [Pseudomonadota bacterium]